MITTTPNGCVDTVVYPDLIEVQGPTGTFSATPTSGCVPLTTTFNAVLSSNTKTMWCDLGDGTLKSDSLHFTHTYTSINSFNPKFILVDHVGCTVPYDLPAIVTHQLPTFEVKDSLVCQGSTVSISLGNDKYQWTPSTFLDCDTCGDVNITPQTTTTYSITATNEFGCQSTKGMTVSSDSLPVLHSQPVTVCLNSSVNLFVGDAYGMSWSPGLYLSDSTSTHPVCTPLQSTTYRITAANSLGCTVSTELPVTVIEKIELNDMADTTICSYDPIQLNSVLTVSPNADIKYTWTPASFSIADDNASPIITGLNRNTTFRVIVSSGTCIPDTATIRVNVLSLPTMEVSDAVTTAPMAEIPLYASSRQDLNYQWTSYDSLSCTDCRLTNLYPTQSQFAYVTGTDAAGCKVTDSVKVTVMQCDPNAIFLPNIFTPNNDGLNDKFMVRSKVLTNLSYFRVFDQWGQMVYETKNVNDGWDGTIKGQPAPVAVYVCMLGGECNNGSDVTKSSNITLIR
jgi:gliding motility-associated-like protein